MNAKMMDLNTLLDYLQESIASDILMEPSNAPMRIRAEVDRAIEDLRLAIDVLASEVAALRKMQRNAPEGAEWGKRGAAYLSRLNTDINPIAREAVQSKLSRLDAAEASKKERAS